MLVFAEIDPGMKGYGGAWGTERRPVTVSIFFIYSSILGSFLAFSQKRLYSS